VNAGLLRIRIVRIVRIAGGAGERGATRARHGAPLRAACGVLPSGMVAETDDERSGRSGVSS